MGWGWMFLNIIVVLGVQLLFGVYNLSAQVFDLPHSLWHKVRAFLTCIPRLCFSCFPWPNFDHPFVCRYQKLFQHSNQIHDRILNGSLHRKLNKGIYLPIILMLQESSFRNTSFRFLLAPKVNWSTFLFSNFHCTPETELVKCRNFPGFPWLMRVLCIGRGVGGGPYRRGGFINILARV